MCKKIFEVYSDGAALHMKSKMSNKKQGIPVAGVAAYVILDNKNNELHKEAKVYYSSSVKFYELSAVADSLKYIAKNLCNPEDEIIVNIFTDNMSNIRDWKNLNLHISNEWYINKKFTQEDGRKVSKIVELETRGVWQSILDLQKEYNLKFTMIHVKGHQSKIVSKSKDKAAYYNEMCDTMAVKHKNEHYKEIKKTALGIKYMELSFRRENVTDSITDPDKAFNNDKWGLCGELLHEADDEKHKERKRTVKPICNEEEYDMCGTLL